jgi:DNA-binding NarL/FixJ family response regulator
LEKQVRTVQEPLSVYLVDDSPTFIHILRRILGDEPLVRWIGSAGDGEKAILEVQRLKPEAVVIDLLLSRGTGFDVLRALHAQYRGRLYVLTSFSTPEYRSAAASLGVDEGHFFDKASGIEGLLKALRSLTQGL